MLKAILTFIIIVSACCAAQSQTAAPAGGTAIARGVIVDGDTIPHVRLREIKIMPRRRFRSKRAAQRYSRLVRNIKTVLPYARIAGRKIAEIEDNLALMSDEKQKKEYLKKAEKELFQEFEKPLRRLTVSQGRLLIKLIDRETGSTSYAIIRLLGLPVAVGRAHLRLQPQERVRRRRRRPDDRIYHQSDRQRRALIHFDLAARRITVF